MEQLNNEKQEFLKKIVPAWDQKAKERENQWYKPENENH